MKLDFNFELLDLDGTVIKNENVSKILANKLASASKGDALKFWDWAKKLFKCEVIDLDKSDQETLKGFIKDSELPIIYKAQILEIFLKE